MLPTPEVREIDFEKVYEPAEDSFLLIDCLEQEKEYLMERFHEYFPVALELGAGSGIVSSFLMKSILSSGFGISTDLNPHACEAIKKTLDLNLDKNSTATHSIITDVVRMDLSHGFKKRSVDLLLFNPPYVPAEETPKVPQNLDSDEWLDLALLGGEDGMETTWAVLNDLDSILSEKYGVAYILFCARNHPEKVVEIMHQKGWSSKKIITRKAGWEVLTVVRFAK